MAGVKGKGGVKGRSGRKSKAEELGLTALLDECWTVDSRKKTIKKLASLANAGNLEAIKILMAYTFGKPKETVAIEGELQHSIIRVPVKAQSREEWERLQKAQSE
jgi:hypothetical protein